jgi:predicted Rossmann fold nucleotide-binding protein DprA/Smf involved in DNA uptake
MSSPGARVQAALALGREVGAVPGRITDESAGPNLLIREGAATVLETKDVLDLLGVKRRMAA